MITPFDRKWLNNKWYVLLLIVIAINQWYYALKEIKEIKFRIELKQRINELCQ